MNKVLTIMLVAILSLFGGCVTSDEIWLEVQATGERVGKRIARP